MVRQHQQSNRSGMLEHYQQITGEANSSPLCLHITMGGCLTPRYTHNPSGSCPFTSLPSWEPLSPMDLSPVAPQQDRSGEVGASQDIPVSFHHTTPHSHKLHPLPHSPTPPHLTAPAECPAELVVESREQGGARREEPASHKHSAQQLVARLAAGLPFRGGDWLT